MRKHTFFIGVIRGEKLVSCILPLSLLFIDLWTKDFANIKIYYYFVGLLPTK